MHPQVYAKLDDSKGSLYKEKLILVEDDCSDVLGTLLSLVMLILASGSEYHDVMSSILFVYSKT